MEERLNSLEIALNNEMNEHLFYQKNAERSAMPVVKAMFMQIAGEELEHYERLRQLAEIWKEDKKWPDTLPLKVKGTEVRAVFMNAVQSSAKPEAGGNQDELQAIRTAIEFEAKGTAFYAKLRDWSTDPKEKAFFGLMADIEHEHFASLKDTEEFFVDPGAWFQRVESTNLDGA